MSYLLAIDPASSSMGYALFNDEGILIEAGTLEAGGTGAHRRLDMAGQLGDILDRAPKDGYIKTIAMEEPKLSGRYQSKSQSSMDKLLGHIEFVCLTSGFDAYDREIYYYHPMTVKSFCGHGSKDKLEVAMFCGEWVETEREKELIAKLIDNEEWDATDAIAVGLLHIDRTGE